jgi:hypothetical protein
MNLSDVMAQVALQLDTIGELRVYDSPPGALLPPAVVVSYPDRYDYDATYDRGLDRLTLPVVVVVGKPTERSTRELLAAYADGSGPRSVKAVVEAGAYTAFDSARVASVEFDVVTIGGTDYMAALFDLDIAGKGS